MSDGDALASLQVPNVRAQPESARSLSATGPRLHEWSGKPPEIDPRGPKTEHLTWPTCWTGRLTSLDQHHLPGLRRAIGHQPRKVNARRQLAAVERHLVGARIELPVHEFRDPATGHVVHLEQD